MGLHLFLDSADPRDWQRWLPSGLFHGITCNPTLLRRAGQPCRLDHLARLSGEALALGAQELHLQAWGGTAEAFASCGRQLAALAPGAIVVKLPLTQAGVLAARSLQGGPEPCRITLTACYEVPQVLLGAALGVEYVAPYLGRLCDLGRDGHAELIAMQRCLEGVASPLKLLVASLRQPADLSRLAAAGLHCFTISPAIAAALFGSEATAAAAEQFERDARDGATGEDPPSGAASAQAGPQADP
ncbi:MAG: transaldolase family protein [Synechococcaceae cyanobacterium]|nr:transaldolase family protein [Synechococcaceae cyanobacterium]